MNIEQDISALGSSNSLTSQLQQENYGCLLPFSSKSLPAEESHSSIVVSGQRSDDRSIPTAMNLQAVTTTTPIIADNQSQPGSPKDKLLTQNSDDIVKIASHNPPMEGFVNASLDSDSESSVQKKSVSKNDCAPHGVVNQQSGRKTNVKLYRPPHAREVTGYSNSSPTVPVTSNDEEEVCRTTKEKNDKSNSLACATSLPTTSDRNNSSIPNHLDPNASVFPDATFSSCPRESVACVALQASESTLGSEKGASKEGFNSVEGSVAPTPSGDKTPIAVGGMQTPSKLPATVQPHNLQQQSLVGQSPKKAQKKKKTKQAPLVPSLVSQTPAGPPANEPTEEGAGELSFRSELHALINNGVSGIAVSDRQKNTNHNNNNISSSTNSRVDGNTRKARKSPRNSIPIPAHHHYQPSPPAVLSPSNHMRRNSSVGGNSNANSHHHPNGVNRNRNNAYIQTESSNIIDSMMTTGSPVVGNASGSVTNSVANGFGNYPLRYDGPWTRPIIDPLASQIINSPFIDMLPTYIDCCIGTKDCEKEIRQHVYQDVQAVVKEQFGPKADAHIYGSVVTDLALPFSDIDILVTGFHPISPLDAIQKMSTALLEVDEDRLTVLKQSMQQVVDCQCTESEGFPFTINTKGCLEADDQKDRESNIGDLDNVVAEAKEMPPVTTSPFISSLAVNSTLTPDEAFSLRNPIEEKEQYRCREELESAEEEFRSQIVKDYTFSKKSAEALWGPISRTGSISEPTEFSKGTNTDVTSTPVVPIITKITSVDSFREGSRVREREKTADEGKTSVNLGVIKTEVVEEKASNTGDAKEEGSTMETRVAQSPPIASSQTDIPSQGHRRKDSIRDQNINDNVIGAPSIPNEPNSVPLTQEVNITGGGTGNVGRALPTYYTFVPTLEGPLYRVQTITSARVPVIKITEKSTNQRADITFGGGEHFRSLQMTQTLLETFPHSRHLIRFLKQCVAKCSIGESAPGGITSFAIYLMVRHVYNMVFNRLVNSFKASANGDGVDVFLKICHEKMERSKDLKAIEKSIRAFLGTSKDLSKETKVLSDAVMESSLSSTAQINTTGTTENPNGCLTSSTGSGADVSDTFVNQTKECSLTNDNDIESKKGSKNIVGALGFHEEESPENSAHYNIAAAVLRDNINVTYMFRVFCYYYGCQFNYESEGIRFSLEGRSDVVPKPFQCARRGQLFHLTSPFDPDYDVTARMTCMREFQYLCEYFHTIAIPNFTFYMFLQFLSPQTTQTDLMGIRNYLLREGTGGAAHVGIENDVPAPVVGTTSSQTAAVASSEPFPNSPTNDGERAAGVMIGEGEEPSSAVVGEDCVSVGKGTNGCDSLISPGHGELGGARGTAEGDATPPGSSLLEGTNSSGGPPGKHFVKFPKGNGDSRRSGGNPSSKSPSPSSVGGTEVPHPHHHLHHHHYSHANSSMAGGVSPGFPSSPNGIGSGGKWDHYYRGYSQYVGACSPVTAGGTYLPQMYPTQRGGAALSRGGPSGMPSPSYGNFYDANLFGYAMMMPQQHQHHTQHQPSIAVNDAQHTHGPYAGSPPVPPLPTVAGDMSSYSSGNNNNRSMAPYSGTVAHGKTSPESANNMGNDNASLVATSTSDRSKSSPLTRVQSRSKISSKNEPGDTSFEVHNASSAVPSSLVPPRSSEDRLIRDYQSQPVDLGSESTNFVERSVTAVPSDVVPNRKHIPVDQAVDDSVDRGGEE